MWDTNVECMIGTRRRTSLRAMLFGTINDFPAYDNLPGYRIKGKCACPLCKESTYCM